MEDNLKQLSWLRAIVAATVSILTVAFYRLFFHPLSRFPGPRLAALTRYYEAYYDLYQNGQYTMKIAELHKQYGESKDCYRYSKKDGGYLRNTYGLKHDREKRKRRRIEQAVKSDSFKGPIIRISPYELHVSDPDFFETLYRQDAHYDKYRFAVDAFGATGATLLTAEHHVHRARRQPMSPFFSKSKVASRQDMIYHHLDKLFRRFAEYIKDGSTFQFGAATTAFVRDVTNDFVLGKAYNSLDRDDFDIAQLTAGQGSGGMWRLTKFLRFVAPTIQSIPSSWMLKVTEGPMREFLLFLEETRQDTRKLIAAATSNVEGYSSRRTLIHEIMDSKLPPPEKEWKRVFQDVSTVTGAGYETTASVLRLVCFHIFSNERILQRLRAELASASITVDDSTPDLKVLEQLPYLTAIIYEGLRLSPAIATRMARISPNDDIVYKKWRIPAGTPVGMTLILMHTDEKMYANPQSFSPDRWIEAGALKRRPTGFAPFSKGTRNCLGMQLAWAEMYIYLANIVQRFELHFPSACAEDFKFESDQFAIGTKGEGRLDAVINHRQNITS